MTRIRRWLLLVAGQYPLEASLTVWGIVSGTNVAFGGQTSTTMSTLPEWMQYLWSGLIALAALTVMTGLAINRMASMATGMYLFGSTLMAYAVAILSTAGWVRGGSISGLLMIIGIMCLVRARWLNREDAALIKEINRNHGED